MALADACTESMSRFYEPHPTPATIPGERRSWAPSHADPHVKYRSIIEGRCPDCGGVLERQAICGWCPSCRAGWTYQGSSEAQRRVVGLVQQSMVSPPGCPRLLDQSEVDQ